jgi:hypothetical protein
MNHSFHSVDRTTHVKIVALALIAAMAIAGSVIAGRFKAGIGAVERTSHQPAMIASDFQPTVR